MVEVTKSVPSNFGVTRVVYFLYVFSDFELLLACRTKNAEREHREPGKTKLGPKGVYKIKVCPKF